MKRIALFLATNLAIVLVLSFTARLLGLEPYLTAQGLNLGSLLVFAAVMGFGGSFLSLALSKWTAKRAMGVQVIETPVNPTEDWLVQTVRRQAERAGIGMPEVGFYRSDEVNAFVTGMSRHKALIAVSTGLLEQLTREEAEAVLGHEVAHAANGDMVTLALIQGVVNTFVMFLSRVIGHTVDRVISAAAARQDGGVWHRRRRAARLEAPVHDAPAAGRAHRRAGVARITLRRLG